MGDLLDNGVITEESFNSLQPVQLVMSSGYKDHRLP